MPATQIQLYVEARRKIADANELFLQFVKDGMTRRELKACIDRRPELWSRFSHWLKRLPTN